MIILDLLYHISKQNNMYQLLNIKFSKKPIGVRGGGGEGGGKLGGECLSSVEGVCLLKVC
jgi:hypothetical protein